MEVTDQEAPIIFSQMLQMFPNIPHNIIWQYIQKYSSDMEKCVEMLNLQSGKSPELTSSDLDNNKLLNNCQILINHADSDNSARFLFENNNETHLPNQLLLLNNDISQKTVKNDIVDYPQEKLMASSSQNIYSLPKCSSNAVPQTVPSVDNSKTSHNLYNFNEPLTLHIDVDNDNVGDTVHSWRPNFSDALCSDLFLTSPMFEDFQFNHVVDLNSECNIPEIQVNSVREKQKSFSYSTKSTDLNHVPAGERAYVIDVASHLHFQQSQMNAIRYEVIKAKIELSDLKETEEKLQLELNDKIQTKKVQDIEQLNKEIVDLRLECQCLCSEVYSLNDEVLLGEVDENYYGENNPTSAAGAQNPVNDHPVLSQNETDSDAPDELERWQCSKCTFANHPDINTCEMCHIEKPSTLTQNAPFVATAVSSSCYCHPKKESLSVKS